MELTDLENLIRSRRSIRSWRDKQVPRHLLLRAIEIATWAPNGANQQNYHFYVIMSKELIAAIADAVQASANQISSWPEAEKFIGTVRFRERASYFRDAPAAIAVAASQYHLPIDQLYAVQAKTSPQARRIRKGRNLCDIRIQSVAAAISYLLLVLHQMGLGAVWMTSPMQAKEEIEKILRVPSEMDIIAFIPVGYPTENPTPGKRKPIGEVCNVIG